MDILSELDLENMNLLDSEGEVDLEDGQIHLEEYQGTVSLDLKDKILKGDTINAY